MKSISFFFVLAFFLVATTSLYAQDGEQVIVKISNIPANQGKVMLTTENGKYYGMADATSSTVDIILDNVPDGKYTVYVFHDANGNYIMDKEGEIPIEYCATEHIDVNENNRLFAITLVNVREKVNEKHGNR